MRLRLISFFAAMMAFASPAFAVMEDYPSIKLQGLDKSVGRTITFEAKVGSTIQYGPLFIKIHACRKAPPIEAPESAAFLQIWEVPPGADKSEWVFSGWMFASSPALSAMDHPVYDVWVLDCTGREEPNEEAASAETSEQADQTTLPPADEEQPVSENPVATDAEGPLDDPAVSQDPAITPPMQNTPLPAESDIPVDGEADMTPDSSQDPSQTPYPLDPPAYGNPADAPYVPPQSQGMPPPVSGSEGIYSPSQGRVVPAQDMPPVY